MVEGIFGLLLDDWALGVKGDDLFILSDLLMFRVLGVTYNQHALESSHENSKEETRSSTVKSRCTVI